MITLQYTMFDPENKGRPISTLVKVESLDYYKAHQKEVHKTAIHKICAQRYVPISWIKENNYLKYKVRVYDKEKIKAENAERYEKIKKERGWA